MDDLDLKAFRILARNLHFAQSAEELNLSPSALTRRIQGIEEEIGQKLLLRKRGSISLTAAGKRLLEYSQQHDLLYQTLIEDLREEEQQPSGELKIACTVTACHSLLPSILASFRSRYPRISLKLLTQDAHRSLEQLRAGEVDLAVIPTEGSQNEIFALKLSSTELSCIAPISIAEPNAEKERNDSSSFWKVSSWVAPLGGLERKKLDLWRRKVAPKSQLSAEVRGNEGIIAMVSLGMGLALVPELVLQNSPLKHRVRVLDLPDKPSGYDISLCTMPNSLERRVVRLFWESAGPSSQ